MRPPPELPERAELRDDVALWRAIALTLALSALAVALAAFAAGAVVGLAQRAAE